jgi:hypothetical protein
MADIYKHTIINEPLPTFKRNGHNVNISKTVMASKRVALLSGPIVWWRKP